MTEEECDELLSKLDHLKNKGWEVYENYGEVCAEKGSIFFTIKGTSSFFVSAAIEGSSDWGVFDDGRAIIGADGLSASAAIATMQERLSEVIDELRSNIGKLEKLKALRLDQEG